MLCQEEAEVTDTARPASLDRRRWKINKFSEFAVRVVDLAGEKGVGWLRPGR